MANNVAKINLPDKEKDDSIDNGWEDDQASALGASGWQDDQAANDSVENGRLRINEVQGAAKKIGDDKIELIKDLKTEVNDGGKAAMYNAAVAGAAALATEAANDNVETETPSEVPEEDKQTVETPAPEQTTEEEKPTAAPSPSETPEKPKTTPPPEAKKMPAQEPAQNNALPTQNSETTAPPQQTNQQKQPPARTPNSGITEDADGTRTYKKNKDNGEQERKKAIEQKRNAPISQNRPPTTPKTPKDRKPRKPSETLGEIGPHGQSKTPPLAVNPAQTQTDMNARKAQNAPAGTIPTSAPATLSPNQQNAPNNVSSNFESDRGRKKQLRKERKKTEKELNQLENKIDGVKSSLAMLAIRFWFPAIYAQINSITMGSSNVKGIAKITLIQTKLVTLNTLKIALYIAKVVAAAIDGFVMVVDWLVGGLLTGGIVTFLVAILFPLAYLAACIYVFGTNSGTVSLAIKEIMKEVDKIIENLKKMLGTEKNKLQKRRKIQSINQALAGTKEDRKYTNEAA